MDALLSNPWNVAIILVLPVAIIALSKSLKRFNDKICEKSASKPEAEG